MGYFARKYGYGIRKKHLLYFFVTALRLSLRVVAGPGVVDPGYPAVKWNKWILLILPRVMWWAGQCMYIYIYIFICMYVFNYRYTPASILWRSCLAFTLTNLLSFPGFLTNWYPKIRRRYTFSKAHHFWCLSVVDKRFDCGFAKEGGDWGATRNVAYEFIW